MSQRIKEFVRQSGVEIQSPNSNSDNNLARELDNILERGEQEKRPSPREVQVPQRLQRNMINNRTYEKAFRELFHDPNYGASIGEIETLAGKRVKRLYIVMPEPW